SLIAIRRSGCFTASRSRARSTRSTRRSRNCARAATSSSTRPRRWSRSTSIPAARRASAISKRPRCAPISKPPTRSGANCACAICIYVPTTVALYMLNQKRESLAQIEARYGIKVVVARDDSLIPPSFRLERLRAYGAGEAPTLPRSIQAPAIEDEDEEADETEEAEIEAAPPRANGADAAGEPETDEERGRRRRRRRRRRSDD